MTAEQQQDGAVGRVAAFLDGRAELQKRGGVAGRSGADVIAHLQTSVPWELTESDLRAVLAERTALAARVAELEAEREADARAAADAIRTIGRIWAGEEPSERLADAWTDLRSRFDDRITAQAGDETDGSGT